MQFLLKPYAVPIPPYVWWDNVFNENELNYLQNLAKSSTITAMVGNGNVSKEDLERIRRSKINWIENTQEYSWIYERLSHVVSSVNAEYYRFDLTGFGEPLQLSNYDESAHGMYGWHVDYGSGAGNSGISRKLSLVLQLTDPAEYEGGNLQLLHSGAEPTTVRKQKGLVAAFPSFTLHQVTPVTKGSRQSLVVWISGPQFR